MARRRLNLEEETGHFEARVKELLTRSDDLAAREVEFADRLAKWELERASDRLAEESEQPLEVWPALRERYEKLLAELRNEVERLALMLLESTSSLDQSPRAA